MRNAHKSLVRLADVQTTLWSPGHGKNDNIKSLQKELVFFIYFEWTDLAEYTPDNGKFCAR